MDILTKRAESQHEHHLSSEGAKSYHIISPTNLAMYMWSCYNDDYDDADNDDDSDDVVELMIPILSKTENAIYSMYTYDHVINTLKGRQMDSLKEWG